MNEVTKRARQRVLSALGDLVARLTVEARPCNFVTTPLAEANVCITIRPSHPCADLNAAEETLASLPGLVYLARQRSEVWVYLNTEAGQ